MALKQLQSAHYPRAKPKLQTGRTAAENDADYKRLQQALKIPRKK
jgi:hypothetical protein